MFDLTRPYSVLRLFWIGKTVSLGESKTPLIHARQSYKGHKATRESFKKIAGDDQLKSLEAAAIYCAEYEMRPEEVMSVRIQATD